jgi:hypothetical protein
MKTDHYGQVILDANGVPIPEHQPIPPSPLSGALTELQARRNDCKRQSGEIIMLRNKGRAMERDINEIIAVANHDPEKLLATIDRIAGMYQQNAES